MHDYNKGILLMIATTLVFAMQDTITKQLAHHLPILQFVGMRFLVFCLFAGWLATRKRSLKEVLRVKHPYLQIARGVLLATEIVLFGYTLRYLGLGQMHSIFATFPLLVTALSPLLLGEQVGWRRWMAVGIGFIGTLIIIAPGSLSFTVYSLLALSCALMFALYNLFTRLVSDDPVESSLFYTGLVGAILCVPFVPFVWQPMAGSEIFWLILLCLFGVLSHSMMIRALQLTPAVILQPFNYLSLPWAIFMGSTFFSERIQTHQLLGALLVISSGMYVAYRQHQLRRTQSEALGKPLATSVVN